MATRHPKLLNIEGQRLLEQAFQDPTRQRAYFIDIADAYMRALRDHGLLDQYLIPDVDPFERLKLEMRRYQGE
jgi:hypothetical protein